MLAIYKNRYVENKKHYIELSIYGDYINEVNDLLIRDRNDVLREYSFAIKINSNGEGVAVIDESKLNDIPPSSYAIFLRYKGYNRINIRKKDISFYTTINSNLGLKIQ
ncbi:hypothetical protein [Oceanobacillus massiliensis]|uniref:hypothetical protein n=1 Tax=Oceanobacillus massiliensis TaxID=1465765 RepID=UPI000288B839|nr:hypothetical protein [Oceanobacillus massiliensis]